MMVRGWEKQPHFVVSSPFSTLCPPHSLFVKSLYYVTFRIGETVLCRNESIEPSPLIYRKVKVMPMAKPNFL